MTNPYDSAFSESINDPEGFWGKVAEDCHWYKRWDTVLDNSNKPFYRWFTGGTVNTCYNALDHHVEKRKAGGNPGCRCILESNFPAQGQIDVYGAHGIQGHQTR